MNRQILRLLVHALVALTLGFLCYVLFREHTWLNRLAPALSLPASATPVSRFLRWYLPDALWGYALCCVLSCVVSPLPACLLTAATGIAWEAAQAFLLVPGTGDLFDVLTYTLAGLLAVMITKKRG